MNAHEKADLIEEMFKLSKVQPSERVLVVTTHDYNHDDLTAYRIALQRLETQFKLVPLKEKPRETAQNS